MTKLILIDGNAIMHRAYHALPPLTSKKGELINAVYGFVSMLFKVIDDLEPTHLVVCFDRPEPTFRKELSEDYQAQRPEMETELSGQFAKIYKVLKAMNIPIYSKAGFEADDLIGTIVDKNKKLAQIIIVTGDKDLLQLVNAKIKVYMPVKGLSEGKLFGNSEVVEKLGILPEQIVDYKALVGDQSDNYKGVSGIGPKTAINLLKEYLTLERIYTNLEILPPKIKLKLEDGEGSAMLSQKLAQIVKDVDINFKLPQAGKWDIKSKKVIKVFTDFGFKTHLAKITKSSLPKNNNFKSSLTKAEIERLILKIVKKLGAKHYAVRGTASLLLQSIEMQVNDIDIICDKKTALLFNKLFAQQLVEKVKYSQSDNFKSYFGRFAFDSVLVEVMGEWQIKSRGKWSRVFNASEAEINMIKVNDKPIPVTKPETELAMFAAMGRWTAYHKIKKQIEKKSQPSLF
jgi:DNA polymerase-1